MPVAHQKFGESEVMGAVQEVVEVGGPVANLAGAVWADRDNDGNVDGYVYNGQYYAGPPSGYDSMLRNVGTGAPGGIALGSTASATIPAVGVEAAIVGAPVGGLVGALWADRDNDGLVDGYVYNGEYYAGIPPATPPATEAVSGERG